MEWPRAASRVTLGPQTTPLWGRVSRGVAGLTVVGHGHPRVQPALVQHGIEVAALDVAEGGAASRAAVQVAEAQASPLAHAVFALVLGPVGGPGRPGRCPVSAHCTADPGAGLQVRSCSSTPLTSPSAHTHTAHPWAVCKGLRRWPREAPALPPACCMTLGKSLALSGP